MKPIYKITSIILIAGIAATLIIACNKSDDEVIVTSGIVQPFSPAKEAVPDLLSRFTQQHRDYKAGIKTSGGTMDLGEAVWTLEGGVNFEYMGDKSELRFTALDTLFLTAPVFIDENQVYKIYPEHVYNTYDEMLMFAATLVNDENPLLFANLDIVSTQQTYVELKYTVALGRGGPSLIGKINHTDYWYAVFDQGKCDTYTGQHIGRDATDRIRHLLNREYMASIPSYWTHVWVYENVDDDFASCPSGECFWGPFPYVEADTTCLDPLEMTHWLNNAAFVVEDLTPFCGMQRIYADFRYRRTWGKAPIHYFEHYFEFIGYGIPHATLPPY